MPPTGFSCRIHSPAKINLNLSVTGRRPDGFHELYSVVCKTRFGDTLSVQKLSADESDRLECSDPQVPVGADNLVLKALQAVRSEVRLECSFAIKIEKRIPAGAGLGGGSGNAATFLKVLQQWFPESLSSELCGRVADSIGSDCRLFLTDGPCLMSGRGEYCEPLPEAARRRLAGQAVWLICPDISISTPKAYSLFSRCDAFTSSEQAREAVAEWLEKPGLLWPRTGNDFERVLACWMPSYALVLAQLNALAGVEARLTGSGSAIFATIPPELEITVTEILHKAWGELRLLVQTLLE